MAARVVVVPAVVVVVPAPAPAVPGVAPSPPQAAIPSTTTAKLAFPISAMTVRR